MEKFKIGDYVYHNAFSLNGEIVEIKNTIAYVKIDNWKHVYRMPFRLIDLSHIKLLNYRECSIEDFNKAMESENKNIQTLSNEYLYILYTKFEADASACYQAGTLYSRELARKSKKNANLYKEELQNRGINIS